MGVKAALPAIVVLAAGAARAGGDVPAAPAPAAPAAAAPAPAAVPALLGGATVDWARGLVIADGVGVADRHAPSPAVALGTSRRVAEAAARHAIAAALPHLPLAKGGVLGAHPGKAIEARLDAAVDAAIELAAEPETDGAWRVTMAVPIEAVRQAIVGPRALPSAGDAGDPVVVIDGVTADPAVGWTIVPAPAGPAAGGALDAATVWVSEVPAWAKSAPHVTATATARGRIEIPSGHGTAGTLFVIAGAHPTDHGHE